MILLDIDLSMLPKDKIKGASNGHKYIKLCLVEMQQPDKFGNEYTMYVSQDKEERGKVSRLYVGKGKEYGTGRAKAAVSRQTNDFPDDLNF